MCPNFAKMLKNAANNRVYPVSGVHTIERIHFIKDKIKYRIHSFKDIFGDMLYGLKRHSIHTT
jgi:hypothetical protein